MKMISEQDKKAFLNGSYGITRNGNKAKLAFTTTDPVYMYHASILSKEDLSYTVTLNENLQYQTSIEDNNDIVGLWEEKLEPFNLEKALNGEPVKLRCGLKAYIKYDLPSEYKGKYPLNGYYIDPKNPKELVTERWARDGKAFIFEDKHDLDIIGMWKDLNQCQIQ